VTQAIETIASVSEENSAAVEEVSASAEELNAEVEEVTASAQNLAEMAESLQRVVSHFHLGTQFKLPAEQKLQSEEPESARRVLPAVLKKAATSLITWKRCKWADRRLQKA
jgi:hypothetical protein